MPVSQKRGVFLVLFPLEDIIQVRIICFFHGGSSLLRKPSWASYLPSAKIYNFWCSFSHSYRTIWVFISSRVIRAHCESVPDSFPGIQGPTVCISRLSLCLLHHHTPYTPATQNCTELYTCAPRSPDTATRMPDAALPLRHPQLEVGSAGLSQDPGHSTSPLAGHRNRFRACGRGPQGPLPGHPEGQHCAGCRADGRGGLPEELLDGVPGRPLSGGDISGGPCQVKGNCRS